MLHRSPPALFVVVAAVIVGGGCASHSRSTAPSIESVSSASATGRGYDSAERLQHARLLCIGMHKPQVVSWMGLPQKTAAITRANGSRETWTYELIHPPVYKTIAAVMEKVPYVDPFTGQLKWLDEPVYNQQRIQHFETITLTLEGPRVVDITRSVRERSQFRD